MIVAKFQSHRRFFGLLLFTLAFCLAGCVGPLVTHETARTVGYHNSEVIAGGGNEGLVLKYNFGLSENFDFGVQWESLSLGLRMKYALINNSVHGSSLALAGGLGTTFGGSYYNADIIYSYLLKTFEPYTAFRYVHVNIDPQTFKDQDTGDTIFSTPPATYNYGDLMLGTRIWLTPHWLISLEGGSLIAMTSGLTFTKTFIASGAVGYRW